MFSETAPIIVADVEAQEETAMLEQIGI